MPEIANEDLTALDVPGDAASWFEIMEFALTFDGYAFWGNADRCQAAAEAKGHATLTALRTCLFWEQRKWRWGDEGAPSPRVERYCQSILRKIRRLTRGVAR